MVPDVLLRCRGWVSGCVIVGVAGGVMVERVAGSLIDFDHTAGGVVLTTTNDFLTTTALRDAYAPLGVHFTGATALDGGAILSENGHFGVSPFSGQNFLAFNVLARMADGGVPQMPETIAFDSGVSSVSLEIAGGYTTDTFTLTAFDSNDAQVGFATVQAQNWVFLNVGVTGADIRKVVLSTTSDGVFVVDDLRFSVPESGTVGWLGAAGVGLMVRRRRRKFSNFDF